VRAGTTSAAVATVGLTPTRLATLYEVGRRINTQLDLQALLDESTDLAIELLQAEKGLIVLRDRKSPFLPSQVTRAVGNQTIDEPIEMSRSIAKRVGVEGRSVLIRSVPAMEHENITKSLARYHINSVICVPLRIKDRLIGSIYVDTTDENRCFQREDLLFMEAFANLAAIAIENASIHWELNDLNQALEQKVEERTAQLVRSEKMASLGLLVAGITHEINTPLGAVNSSADVILRSSHVLKAEFDALAEGAEQSPGKARQMLETMEQLSEICKDSCKRISVIIEALRNFARLDDEEIRPVDIHEGLENTLTLIQNQCAGRIRIMRDYGALPAMSCRAGELNQVFMNLLVNACEAIAEEGEIRIRTFGDDEYSRVEIQDTGNGIKPEHVSRVFDPGFTTKGVGVGKGLGLSTAYMIVQEHGGTISVSSDLGKGSTFTVSLPTSAQPTGPESVRTTR
jgi:signal transduction histidine kinase